MILLGNCPLCSGSNLLKKFDCIDHSTSKEKFTIVSCETCEFTFTNPRPKDNSLGEYYESDMYISHTNNNKGLFNWMYHTVRKYATNTDATFTWDTTSTYSFVRIKTRVDHLGSAWFNVGGFGIVYPILTKNKNGLIPGLSYRAQARTWCSSNGGAYRSASWSSIVFWTQPGIIRFSNPNLTERTLLRTTDLLGRNVNPKTIINKNTLFYIYDDGTVEKKIIVE